MTKDREKLEEYRHRWTQEDREIRDQRFTTELVYEQKLEGDTTAKYLPPTIRKNPGAPLIIDKIAKIMKDKYGEIKTESLYKVFNLNDKEGSGKMDYKTFRIALADCGVRINDFDYENLTKYFDRNKEGILDYNEFISYYE